MSTLGVAPLRGRPPLAAPNDGAADEPITHGVAAGRMDGLRPRQQQDQPSVSLRRLASNASTDGRRSADAAGSSGDEDDEYDEERIAKLSPESQKRIRRRLANRECARRIRKRRLDLIASLAAQADALRARNAALEERLRAVTRAWCDAAVRGCRLKAELAAAAAARPRLAL